MLSNLLGWLIFIAIFLQKSRGIHRRVSDAGFRKERNAALTAASVLATATLLGVLVISVLPSWVKAGLPLSAGVAICVAATDLVPKSTVSLAYAWRWFSSRSAAVPPPASIAAFFRSIIACRSVCLMPSSV